MSGSIEEFLKMAAARRQQGGQQKQPRQPMVIDDVEIIEADPVQPRAKGGNIRSKVGTTSVSDQASHLGEKIVQKHSRSEKRIHDKFDHEVGKLHVPPEETVSDDAYSERIVQQSTFAKDLVKMLTQPQTISKVIVLNEILNRPDFEDRFS
jgi:hypothetical protein